MSKSEHIWIKVFRKILLPKYLILLPIFFVSSCIKTDTSDCVCFSLNVKVLNADGEDITALGEAGDAQIFLFDENFNYVEKKNVSSEDIINEKQFSFRFRNSSSTFWVVVWSNLNGNQKMVPPIFWEETKIDEALIQMKRDPDGYAINPDDLFSGVLQVCGQCTSNNTISIERKTALMNLSATGISNSVGQDYYFVLKGAKQDAYDFLLNLTGNPIIYRQTSSFFIQENQFEEPQSVITTNPFTVFPLSTGERFVVEIYSGGVLIAVADTDDQGRDIIPIRGETINILLNFSGEAGNLEVKVEVTDWDDIYKWFIW